ncbi:P-loop containing nucleoside triphosphate hydrolase protein, partial [Hygrophoropsis aurantiaca]
MEDRFYRIPSINTQKLTPELLNFLGKSSNDSYQRDQMKSTQTTYQLNDRASWDSTQQQLQTKADRFQNRLRRGANQVSHVRINVGSSNHGFTVGGRVDNTHGRSAHLATAGNLDNKTVTSVTVVGRDDPTSAESQRALALLHILQGTVNLEDNNPWVQWIWLQPPGFAWPWANEVKTPIIRFDPSQFPRPLNQSQISAVEHMLQQTDPTRITLIQGPPGTGKTTVIASYIQAALQGGQTGIWLLAQSNVAVKNIAEKLALFGLFDWKLLVSQDFYVDWHEHLYTDIKSNIIQSQEFSTPGFLSRELHDCPVILCTLSMIFSPILQRQSVFRYAPLKAVVIDEASQIEIGDYIPMFTSHKSIRKICFIGDDKQLPPYGQDNNEALQSIFEVEHLRTQALLLNTQYRMPPQIGDFISQAIYEKQLGSNPEHPVTTDNMACHFINVSLGYEEPSGKSYKNTGECKAILKFAAHL